MSFYADESADEEEKFTDKLWDLYAGAIDKAEAVRNETNLFMEQHRLFFKLEIVNTILSLISVSLYIIGTYLRPLEKAPVDGSTPPPDEFGFEASAETHNFLTQCDGIINFFFLADFIFKLLLSKSWSNFFFNWQCAIDVITIFPSIAVYIVLQSAAAGPAGSNEDSEAALRVSSQLNFLRVARILRLTRLIRMQQAMARHGGGASELSKQMVTESLVMVSLIFIFAGTFLVCESEMVSSEEMNDRWGRERIYFHDALYLTIITISTVGYGDLFPLSLPGKMIVVCMIITSLIVISRQTNQLLTLMSVQSEYARMVYVPDSARSQHVIVCGSISFETARDFLEEFFHPDHSQRDVTIVFLDSSPPSFDMQFLLRSPEYAARTIFLEGSPFNEQDLIRAEASKCKLFFVLSNKFTADVEREDFGTILRCLAFKEHVKHNSPAGDINTIMQLIRSENKVHFSFSIHGNSEKIQTLCMDEIKLHLIAKSCLIPGFCTLISNLTRSASAEIPKNAETWIKEYAAGSEYEIYRAPLSPYFKSRKFKDCAIEIYKEFGCTMFAIEIVDAAGNTQVVLNPANYRLPAGAKGSTRAFLLATDQKEVEKISLYKLQEDSPDWNRMQQKISSRSALSQTEQASTATMENTKEGKRHAMMRERYRCRDKPASLASCSVEGVGEKISEHVLVCGGGSGLYYFIATLRPKHLKKIRIVVVLAPVMDEEVWNQINLFADVYYVRGSPLETIDLIRAGAFVADKAVILNPDVAPGASDADTIFIYQTIMRNNPDIKIVCELVSNTNVAFVGNEGKAEDRVPGQALADDEADDSVDDAPIRSPFFQPPFAAGVVFLLSSLDTMCCQAYYNPSLISILKEMVLTGGSSTASFPDSAQVEASELFCIRVPRQAMRLEKNLLYIHLFKHLVTNMDCIPLGLYRFRPNPQNPSSPHMPYVITNPPRDLVVHEKDLVYALRSPLQGTPIPPTRASVDSDAGGNVSPLGVSSDARGQPPPAPSSAGKRRTLPDSPYSVTRRVSEADTGALEVPFPKTPTSTERRGSMPFLAGPDLKTRLSPSYVGEIVDEEPLAQTPSGSFLGNVPELDVEVSPRGSFKVKQATPGGSFSNKFGRAPSSPGPKAKSKPSSPTHGKQASNFAKDGGTEDTVVSKDGGKNEDGQAQAHGPPALEVENSTAPTHPA